MAKGGQQVRAVPEELTEEERILRAKLIIEEALETVDALGVSARHHDFGNVLFIEDIDFEINPAGEFDMVEVVDGCCDIHVVTTGLMSAMGVAEYPVQDMINESNLAKYTGDWHRRGDGKIMKSSDWKAPDLAGEIERQKTVALSK
jgi:predicted HAD superfamily Cof-like phosphohydrolase